MNSRLQKNFFEVYVLNMLDGLKFTEYLQIVVEIIAVHVPRRLLEEIFLVVHADFQIYIVLYSSSSGWSARDKGKHASFLDQILEKEKRNSFF